MHYIYTSYNVNTFLSPVSHNTGVNILHTKLGQHRNIEQSRSHDLINN